MIKDYEFGALSIVWALGICGRVSMVCLLLSFT